MRVFVLAALVTAAGCSVPAVDYTGKACPCPSGWTCGVTNTCVRGTGDATPSDAKRDARFDAPADGPETYRAAVLADQPAAYWRLDEPAGATTAVDQTGAFNGTYAGTCAHGVPGAIVGDADTAVFFDGATCRVNLPNVLKFIGTSAFSVEAWVDDGAVTMGYHVVFSNESRNGTGPIAGYAIVDSTSGIYFERAANNMAPTTAHVSHANNKYIHLVGVYNGMQMTLYIDGVAGTPLGDTTSMAAYTANAIIGADSSGDWFFGDLDEVAVYGHALTAQQVSAHYAIGMGGAHD